MNNNERKGYWLRKETGEVFCSLRVLPIENESEAEFAKPYELKNETHSWTGTAKEFQKQFVKL